MKYATKEILKKVENFLEAGYKQVVIINGEVYASGGNKLMTETDMENCAILKYNTNE